MELCLYLSFGLFSDEQLASICNQYQTFTYLNNFYVYLI
ncbi:hypothetical protein GALL_62330 [mine drainage metagenome]|uniref:Uncharacterized protein n=1 Tax=mine drainage metagenome TaxID=410659 RepID=A0A1J5TKJ0_9ZZZZ